MTGPLGLRKAFTGLIDNSLGQRFYKRGRYRLLVIRLVRCLCDIRTLREAALVWLAGKIPDMQRNKTLTIVDIKQFLFCWSTEYFFKLRATGGLRQLHINVVLYLGSLCLCVCSFINSTYSTVAAAATGGSETELNFSGSTTDLWKGHCRIFRTLMSQLVFVIKVLRRTLSRIIWSVSGH